MCKKKYGISSLVSQNLFLGLILNTTKSFRQNQSGAVAPIVALILPIMLVFGAFTIQAGNAYIRLSQLDHLAYQSANSGLLAFAAVLTDEAEKNYEARCNGEFLPSVCGSTDPFDFLTDADIQSLVLASSTQSAVQQNVRDFVVHEDPQRRLQPSQISIEFPSDMSPNKVWLRTKISEDMDRGFGAFLPQIDDELAVEAVASLLIR